MAFVDALTKQLEVPGDSGQWMKLRPLSFLEIEDAQVKGYIGLMRTVGEMSEVQETIRHIFDSAREAEAADIDDGEAEEPEEEPEDQDAEEPEKDPLDGLDLLTVLCAGVSEWSYDRPVNEANIRMLDEETARWAALEIVGLRSKADLEKASAPSTLL